MLKNHNRLQVVKLIVMVIVVTLTLVSCGGVVINDNTNSGGSTNVVSARTPPVDWMRVATLAGATLDYEQSDEEIATILNQLAQDGVSVVEADSRLSEYLTDEEFAQDLGLMQSFGLISSFSQTA